MNEYEKYLRVVTLAKRRYRKKSGILKRFIGNKPTAYTLIEQSAASKYLGCCL